MLDNTILIMTIFGIFVFIVGVVIVIKVLLKMKDTLKLKCLWCGRFIVSGPLEEKGKTFCSLRCKKEFKNTK